MVDTIGELGLFYELADFAFIAGSIQEIGGHNPLEAIMSNTAVISGNKVFNFREIYDELIKANSCVIVNDSNELYESARKFIEDPQLAKNLSKKAKGSFDLSKNVSRNIVDLIY